MKQIQFVLFAFMIMLSFSTKADVIGACSTPSPTWNINNNYVIFYTPNTTACKPNGISGASVSSKFTLTGSSASTPLIRIKYVLYRGTPSGSSSFIASFNTVNAFAPPTLISSPYIIQENCPISSFFINGSTYFNGTGTYYVTATLQYFCTAGNDYKGYWTGLNSNTANLSVFDNNNQNNFNLNGINQGSSVAGAINVLDPFNYTINMNGIITNGITNYKIIVEKGTISQQNYQFTASASQTSAVVTSTSVPASINLTSLFGTFLQDYQSWALRVSLVVTGNNSNSCNSGIFTKSQLFYFIDKTAGINYTMNRGYDQTCNSSGLLNDKPIVTTLPISTSSPLGFTTLCPTVGWQGAKSCGISSITYLLDQLGHLKCMK
jgi:hypothetical protein